MLSNKEHAKMMYEQSVLLHSRDTILTEKFGERYVRYRKLWNSDILQENIDDFPLHYEIMLSDECNMRCAICHKRKRTKESLTTDALQKIFAEGYKHTLAACAFGLDSEPLCNAEFLYKAISYAKEYGIMDIIVGSNGLLLNETVAANLIKGGITLLCISIDANTPETYKKIRCSNHFEKIEENIISFVKMREKLGSSLPQIRLSFCKTYINAHEEEFFIQKWKPIVDQIDIQNYISTVGTLQNVASGEKIEAHFCKEPFRRVGILANGDVRCCCCSFGHQDIVIGNIFEESMYDIWNGKKMRLIQDAFIKNRSAIPDYCKTCLNSRYKF